MRSVQFGLMQRLSSWKWVTRPHFRQTCASPGGASESSMIAGSIMVRDPTREMCSRTSPLSLRRTLSTRPMISLASSIVSVPSAFLVQRMSDPLGCVRR